MTLETTSDIGRARDRLRQRDSAALVDFIVSLAQAPGPVGDQVRTFIVGDDVAETVKSIDERIAGLSVPSEYDYRHARGQEIGQQLALIADSIASLVLPVDPAAAFELLVAVFKRDAAAMEQCGDHHWDGEVAYRRAAELLAKAAASVPAAAVTEIIRELMADDQFGVRGSLRQVIVPQHS